MTVYLFPADNEGCGHYRLIWPGSVLFNEGFPVRLFAPNEKTGLPIRVLENASDRTGPRLLADATIPEDATVMVLQRPAADIHPQLVRAAQANGVAVVIDMDDDMNSMSQDNVARRVYTQRQHNWRYAAECCKLADLVTVSTKSLAQTYGAHGRVRIIDNYVPETCLSYPSPPTGRFGWPGITFSHPHDLQVTGDAVRRLIADGHHFTVVGGRSQVQQKLRLDEPPDAVGPVGVDKWVATIGQTLDVGMVPLENSTFNRAKSRLKGIEMMAVGVPWVASPREEYRRLERESGGGLLADTPKQWYSQLKRLITDDTLREELAEAGREYMRSQTYEKNAWRWAEAWEWAERNRRGSSLGSQ